MNKTRSSRLTRLNEKNNKKQTLIFTIGIVVLLVLLIQLGPIIVNVFGNIVYSVRGGDASENQVTGKELLLPPDLIDVPSATQSSSMTIRGIAPESDGIIEFYVNDSLEEEIEISTQTTFEIKDVSIKRGKNVIKARFVKKDVTSPFSKEYIVDHVTSKPDLEISFPQDGQQFTRADRSITIQGKTDADNTITVNSFRAIVDANGAFEYLLQLSDGDNTINVTAENPAGVTTQNEIKVKYTP
jgi:hypothetical protein